MQCPHGPGLQGDLQYESSLNLCSTSTVEGVEACKIIKLAREVYSQQKLLLGAMSVPVTCLRTCKPTQCSASPLVTAQSRKHTRQCFSQSHMPPRRPPRKFRRTCAIDEEQRNEAIDDKKSQTGARHSANLCAEKQYHLQHPPASRYCIALQALATAAKPLTSPE